LLDSANDGAARMRVVDSGPGPPAELVDKLFEPFVTSKPEGVGLGLAVARQIVEAHRGTIVLDLAGETTFEVVLPRIHTAAAAAKASPQSIEQLETEHEKRNTTTAKA
jgi:nitrogen-specific signal transduction histidine kinase